MPQAVNAPAPRLPPQAFRASALALLFLLSACGGGGGSSSDNQPPDPVVVDIPVAYVKRTLDLDDNGQQDADDLRAPLEFRPGAALYIRDRATPSAREELITGGLFAEGAAYDVRDPDVSPDGDKLLFALRAPEPANNAQPEPTWNIWEYTRSSRTLRRVIRSDIVAEAGDDVAPAWLPDGRIVFASTRQRQSRAILLDEGKPQFPLQDEQGRGASLALHVMNADGSDIRQISFNASHDTDPVVLDNGRVLYVRWDEQANRGFHLYTMNPDGSDNQILYGLHSHNTGVSADNTPINAQFSAPQVLEDGRVLAVLRAQTRRQGGQLIGIDTRQFTDNNEALASLSGLQGPAQRTLVNSSITTDDSLSAGGQYRSAFPLRDGTGRLLVTWSQCRVQLPQGNTWQTSPCTTTALATPGRRAAPPLYGLYVLDPARQTQLPVLAPSEGIAYEQAVALAPRARAAALADLTPVAGLENEGVIDLRSVYDFDGVDTAPGGTARVRDPLLASAAARPAHFLRIDKHVALPDDEVRDFNRDALGVNRSFGMREILGYVPVEPDGSARFRLPANVAVQISVLDADGQRISPLHRNWLSVRPGETLQCRGCHTAASTRPHGRPEAQAPSINPGAAVSGQPFANTEPALFANAGETMAQVWARLHGPRLPQVDLLFSDDWTDPARRAKDPEQRARYRDLLTPAPVSLACQDTWQPLCRITVHYLQHIQPLWSADRRQFDPDTGALIADHTCTACHSNSDANGAAQVPAAQLDLRADAAIDNAFYATSYLELLRADNEQELVGGVLRDRLIQIGVDEQGNPVFSTVPINALMQAGSARGSNRFFAAFAENAVHPGWLNRSERKLLAEWLDIGGQYYNDPFLAPEN